ncbi:hypothetical protein BX265_4956 [Streptomyces sp. TLI_235]|nr:hypothetical protein [Streptomyces sp. TLI_235]PBC80120.1 hypothetical protein BX265_4956 [Streptomyces sp. TLI_235]
MSQVNAYELLERMGKAKAWAEEQSRQSQMAVTAGAKDSAVQAQMAVAFAAVAQVLGKIVDPSGR